ncbi:MAG: carboxypeptidase regulatory-like domain-containing protein [Gemmatimonadetes bacterium]|nr:carboxypeptidase regulatory-like domain-containing protein [Gemmatimonadota bacterium]
MASLFGRRGSSSAAYGTSCGGPLRIATLLLGCLLLAPLESVGAQPQLSGRVHMAGDSSRPVVDVELALIPGLRTVRSDSAGAFRFGNVSPGTYTLRARRVGFEVFTMEVRVSADQAQTPRMSVPLRSGGARMLAEIKVSGHRVMYPVRLAEPYQRVARGRGAFFTRELIDSLQPWDVFSLLDRVAGVRQIGRDIAVTRCANHGASPGMPGNLHVYLDGVRQTNFNSTLRRNAFDAIRDVVIPSVQLVEVHVSINTIPPEFADDACAVILLWSR